MGDLEVCAYYGTNAGGLPTLPSMGDYGRETHKAAARPGYWNRQQQGAKCGTRSPLDTSVRSGSAERARAAGQLVGERKRVPTAASSSGSEKDGGWAPKWEEHH